MEHVARLMVEISHRLHQVPLCKVDLRPTPWQVNRPVVGHGPVTPNYLDARAVGDEAGDGGQCPIQRLSAHGHDLLRTSRNWFSGLHAALASELHVPAPASERSPTGPAFPTRSRLGP